MEKLFRVFKNKNPNNESDKTGGWKKIGEFNNFEDAFKLAQTVCPDIYHEGSKAKMYWFSDENSPDAGYKVVIDSENYFKQ